MYPSFLLRPCTIGIVLPILVNTWPSPRSGETATSNKLLSKEPPENGRAPYLISVIW